MDNEVMQIIVYAGNAKSIAMQSIKEAKCGNDELAMEKLVEAEDNLSKAHHAHAKILSEFAANAVNQINLFTVHGEDHMMSAITTIDLAKEFIMIHSRVSNLEKEISEMKQILIKMEE